MQLKIDHHRYVIFEWIPYFELNEIKEKEDNCFVIAIWKNGPLQYYDNKYNDDKKCCKQCQIDQIKNNFTNWTSGNVESCLNRKRVYGLSQNLDTNVYILVYINDGYFSYYRFGRDYCEKCYNKYNSYGVYCKPCQISYFENNFSNWTSGNEKINELIQKNQLEISKHNDPVFEWISYDKFTNISETKNCGFATALWKDGPLHYSKLYKKYRRKLNEVVLLKYLNKTSNIINEIMYLMEGRGGFSTVYSAIWKDGYVRGGNWKRIPNIKVALKCLLNSHNSLDEFINEVKAYSNQKIENILKIYGIS
ncbi:hypothetical protein RclHR1_03020009 [Rhizophagus clarus]|uniref:Protein kinase domain-containing protein n=1 Tax=Rhizophagus clarus TaxID=94130 RepID=A0A2Z6RLQ0_9GLOM|nr:hypothetical protein RclHR1_03020009 [Rhizophagus clarus]